LIHLIYTKKSRTVKNKKTGEEIDYYDIYLSDDEKITNLSKESLYNKDYCILENLSYPLQPSMVLPKSFFDKAKQDKNKEIDK
jgi:hypothetical protein